MPLLFDRCNASFESTKRNTMATHKSAKKRIRGNKRKNIRNRSYMSMVRTAIKKLQVAMQTGQSENLQALFLTAQSLLDKAAQKGIIHKKNASRKIGRLSARVTTAATGKKESAPVVAKKTAAKSTAAKAAKTAAKKTAAKKSPVKKSMPKKKARSKK